MKITQVDTADEVLKLALNGKPKKSPLSFKKGGSLLKAKKSRQIINDN